MIGDDDDGDDDGRREERAIAKHVIVMALREGDVAVLVSPFFVLFSKSMLASHVISLCVCVFLH